MAGTARAATTAVLGLIALQSLATAGGSGRVSEMFADLNTMLERFLDPNVPAIPDLRNGEHWGTGSGAPVAVGAPPNGIAIPYPTDLDPTGAYGYSPYLTPFPVS